VGIGIMTKDLLEHFRGKLADRRAVVNEQIAAAGTHAREPVENAMGNVGDDPVRNLAVDTALDVGALRTRELEEIDDALLRIRRGEYGRCEVCGRAIEIERLEAVPTARLCEADARRADREHHPKL
jgi:RNA polymerase-binding transcription factor DksA